MEELLPGGGPRRAESGRLGGFKGVGYSPCVLTEKSFEPASALACLRVRYLCGSGVRTEGREPALTHRREQRASASPCSP